jgi:quercetin dioxygenase-like cupin family protein
MHSGDSIIIEVDVEHQAMALEDSVVLGIFIPYRSEYAQ